MNARHPLADLTPESHAALYEAARRRAHALRAQALAACWSAAGRALRRAWHAARASGRRRLRARRELLQADRTPIRV